METAFPALLAAMDRRRARFQADMDAAPKSRQCPSHPHEWGPLDVERSWESGQLEYQCEGCQAHEAELAIENRMAMMGVPARVRSATFRNYAVGPVPDNGGNTPVQALTAAEAVVRGKILNLVLCGTPGVGKGHLAAAVLRARMDAGLTGDKWITAAMFFRAYHAAYEDGVNDTIVRFYGRRPLLVIDEMGLGAIPKDGELALSELFDCRWNAQKPTIVISNRSPKKLAEEWLGARVADRLREKSAQLWMAWKSHRQ